MTAIVVQGDARSLHLPDDSVDLIVTSPPYFALRSYRDNGVHMAGQIGAEPTPAAYIDTLLECTREWMRVLKPTGSLWVNLGDKYGPDKSLRGLPWRYALGCIDQIGLALRAEVVWSKSNGLPESVRDRVRRSHEQWFHFTAGPTYYAAVDAIREVPVGGHSGLAATFKRPKSSHTLVPGQAEKQQRDNRPDVPAANPLGKLPGSVWTVASQPLRVPAALGIDHFAAFPMEFPRRIILGWSPEDGTVLDPLGGTGTVALVADVHGRTGISVDLSRDYCRLAMWRTNDAKQRERAMRGPKVKASLWINSHCSPHRSARR